MEDNNNNENQQNEEQKKKRKNLMKFVLKPLIKPLIIISLCLMGIFLTVGLFFAVRMSVLNFFSDLISDYNEKNLENGSSSANNSVIYIDENTGYYKLKDEYSKKIIQQLENHKVNTEVMGFVPENDDDKNGSTGEAIDEETAKELQDMIDKYIKAEVQTTFPKTGNTWWWQNDDEIDGKIIIKRAFADGSTRELKYVKYSEFCSKVESNNTGVLEMFSLNPENFKLCIAKEDSTAVYYKDGIEINREGGGISKEELDYQTYLQNYAVPLNFFITLHVIAQNKAFMEEVVYMATGGDDPEPIIITYVETQQQHTTEYDYTGVAEEEITTIEVTKESNNADASNVGSGDTEAQTENTITTSIDINNNNVHEFYSEAPAYDKEVVISNSGRLYITKANTWLKSSEKQISEMQTEDNEGSTSENYPIQNLPKEIYNNTVTSTNESVTQTKNTKITINEFKEIIEMSSLTKKYTVVDVKSEIEVDEFVDLIESYPKVRNNISTSPSNIFYLLQQNENTQKLEKIMRYVLFRLNDIDYGVRLEDLDFLLEEETFISADGGIYNGGSAEETIWFTMLANGYSKESAAGVLGNIWVESGFKTNNLEDIFEIGGSHSLGHTDQSYTDAINNGTYSRASFISDHYLDDCGAGYGLLQWTWYTRKAALYDLAKSSGRGIDDINVQVEYLLKELDGIKSDSVWRTTNDPYEAGEVLCKGFVNPGASASNVAIRAQKAQEYYDQFKDKTVGTFDTSSGGTLYTGTYTSTRGRTFTILNQNTISGWGAKCNRAAGAIIASGYTNQDASTLINTMNTKYAEAGDTIVPQNNFFNLYGLYLASDSGAMGVSQYTEVLRNQLKSGGYAMIWLNKGAYYGASGTKWTGQIHWVAILDYRTNGGQEQICIADWRGAGWYDIGEFKNGISRIALINEM